MHKDSKWARRIIAMQDKEGKWGYFHTLFAGSKSPYTTEMALRGLEELGYTMEDECIQKAVSYLNDCICGRKEIPDKKEKLHNWEIFTSMMLAAWILRFTKENEAANAVARIWSEIVTAAFQSGSYDHCDYVKAYVKAFGEAPKGGRLEDFVQFYIVSMLVGNLDEKTENAMLEYIINKPDGIYYVYEKCLRELPVEVEGRETKRYLKALELLSRYENSREHLGYVSEWLEGSKK